jgi:SnoaL-like domain
MHPRPATAEQLIARAEIYDVLMHYMRGVDRRNMELVRAAYHPDAVQTNPYLGPGEWGSVEELITLINRNAVHIPMSMHLLANVVYEFAGDDVAIVESYLMAYQTHRDAEGEEGFRQTGSRYLDRFERRDGSWKIAKRVLPLNFIRPLAQAGDQILFTNPVLSTRDADDPLWALRAEAGLE